MSDRLKNDEYYNFRSGGGIFSGSIGEVPPYQSSIDSNLYVIHECIICGKEITNHSDQVCPDCKEAILWAKKKMKKELK